METPLVMVSLVFFEVLIINEYGLFALSAWQDDAVL